MRRIGGLGFHGNGWRIQADVPYQEEEEFGQFNCGLIVRESNGKRKRKQENKVNIKSLHRFGWEVRSYDHRALTSFLISVCQIRSREHPVSSCLLQHAGRKRVKRPDAHICLDDFFFAFREHKVRDEDVKECLHFDEREALAYAGLRTAT